MENAMKRELVFQARGLTKIYRMGEVEVPALRGIDLELYAGELVVLLGPSGSGKSTLLNILGGLDTPTSGEVFYLDHNLTAAGERDLTLFRRDHVGFVFQFYNLIPSLTAREPVAERLRAIPGVEQLETRIRAAAYDMEGAFNNVTATLARGAQQQDVIDRIDGVLAAYGGTGAYPRKDQFSNRFLLEELKQLQTTATIFPAIFLGVAAVLLNVVISRLSALQRDQIAILKAFGYTTAAISGTLFAVLRAARLAPAEGMRPETPAVYRATVLGISCACGVMMVGNYQKGGDRFHGRRAVPPGGARGSRPDLHRAHLGQGAVRAGRPAGRDACRRLPRRAGHPALREPQLPFGRVRHPARRPAAPLARPQPAAGAGARRRRGADRPPGQQDAARAARPDADHRDPRRAPPHRRGAGARHHPAVPRRLRPTCGTSRSTRCCAKAEW